MKYICTKNHKGNEEIFIFPRRIDHDRMEEVLSAIREGGASDWRREIKEPISAGFVDKDLACYGESETLGLKSRKEDTQLLRDQARDSVQPG